MIRNFVNPKEIRALQLEKAKLQRDIDTLRTEVNYLDGFAKKASKLLKDEDRAELTEAEQKVEEHLNTVKRTAETQRELINLSQKKEDLEADLVATQNQLNILQTQAHRIERANKKRKEEKASELSLLEKATQKEAEKLRQLKQQQLLAEMAAAEADELLETTISEIKRQEEGLKAKERAMLRKQHDLMVYERRIERKFAKAFPNDNMKL